MLFGSSTCLIFAFISSVTCLCRSLATFDSGFRDGLASRSVSAPGTLEGAAAESETSINRIYSLKEVVGRVKEIRWVVNLTILWVFLKRDEQLNKLLEQIFRSTFFGLQPRFEVRVVAAQ